MTMALLNLGEDPWLMEYDSCERLQRDLMEQLVLRRTLQRNSDKYSQLSATIRLRLKQYNNEVGQLRHKLETAAQSDLITAAEWERRSRQVEVLHSKSLQMGRMFDEQLADQAMEEERNQAGSSDWGAPIKPYVNVSDYSAGQLREDQSRMLGEQEQGLESLAKIISRQKNIATTISNEVDLHNEILDDLGEHMDRTDSRVRGETAHISVVDSKDKTCVYWVIIILLFISIIVVAAL